MHGLIPESPPVAKILLGQAMEHLPLPKTPTKPLPLVRYANRPYDNGPFLEYLDRHPKTIVDDDGRHFITEVDLFGHYQAWLFFGLLHEFLGEIFDPEDFICQDPDDESLYNLTTRRLPRLLRTWKAESSAKVMTEDPTFSHLSQCLDTIQQKLDLTFWNYHDCSVAFGFQVDIIASVAEAIENTVAEVYEPFNDTIVGGFGKRWDWLRVSFQRTQEVREETINHMRNHGWCRNDIAMAESRFPTLEAWYYFQHLQLDKDPEQHAECNECLCKVSSTPKEVCIPQHVNSECSCDHFEVDPEWLSQTYQDGAIPCVEITPDPSAIGLKNSRDVELDELKMSIRAVSMNETPIRSYVVVSHVWGEGFGNSDRNSLPKCRLWHVWRKIYLWKVGKIPQSEILPLRIWIDTLCLPRRGAQMRSLPRPKTMDIYANAAFLFVVDRSMIEVTNRHTKPLEIGVRLWLSPWMRRLWTAFEVVMTGKDPYGASVGFQIGEDVWDLRGMYRTIAQKTKTVGSFGNEVANEFCWLGKWYWFGQQEQPALGTIRKLFDIVQYRLRGSAVDEPFVLGTLLRFPSELFTGESHETDMCRFWKIASEAEYPVELDAKLLQKQVLFYPAPKLTSSGFHWAPRSLLLSEGQYTPNIFSPSAGIPGYECQVTERGLLASYPSIRIRPVLAQRTYCLFGEGDSCEWGNSSMMIELPDGSWNSTSSMIHDDSVEGVKPRDSIAKGELYLLKHSQDVPLEGISILGVWVRVEEETDGVKYARLLGHTGVASMTKNSAAYAIASREWALWVLDELERDYPRIGSEPSAQVVFEIRDRLARQYLLEHLSVPGVVRLSDRTDADDRMGLTFDDVVERFKRMVHYWAHFPRMEVEVLPVETKWCID